MATRGLFGFRKDGVDKVTYNNWDSYPDGLGRTMAAFCVTHSHSELNDLFDRIVLVEKNSEPTPEEHAWIEEAGRENGPDYPKCTWNDVLIPYEGHPDMYLEDVYATGRTYMTNHADFIRDSLLCEYAYIVNFDTGCLEFWRGFQKKPQPGNRYGETKCEEDKYYPCALLLEIPLSQMKSAAKATEAMRRAAKRS